MDEARVKTIRSNVSSNDASNPSLDGSTDRNFQAFPYAEVEVKITGTNPIWTLTPLLLNNAGDDFMEMESIILTGAKVHRFVLDVLNTSQLNFRCDNQAGTSPVITHIKASGINL